MQQPDDSSSEFKKPRAKRQLNLESDSTSKADAQVKGPITEKSKVVKNPPVQETEETRQLKAAIKARNEAEKRAAEDRKRMKEEEQERKKVEKSLAQAPIEEAKRRAQLKRKAETQQPSDFHTGALPFKVGPQELAFASGVVTGVAATLFAQRLFGGAAKALSVAVPAALDIEPIESKE